MAAYIKTDKLSVVKNEKVFFDANIWIYIFCEIGNAGEYYTRRYSSSFRYFLKNNTSIYIDLTVISEFVNRYLRISHSHYRKNNNLDRNKCDYKKDYRKTDDFKEAWQNVCNIVNTSILAKAKTVNFEYDRNTLRNLLNSDKPDTDFNDTHIINLCRSMNMYLLTHDGDFKNTDINVITENGYYWQN